MSVIHKFVKSKEFLICIDSDGCAMDTMDMKHIRCFGPCLIDEWKLDKWKTEILNRWTEINLYTSTRGINRFVGLAKILSEISHKYCRIDGIEEFQTWVWETAELSNGTVKAMAEKNGKDIFRQALDWSIKVNKRIDVISEEEKRPFEGVKETMEYLHRAVDIAVVSSANREAVDEEWKRCGLLPYTDVICCQESGTKRECIGKLMEYGYENSRILMVGDALGDCRAAESNGVYFYPILARHEAESWKELFEIGSKKFLNLDYDVYGKEKKIEFLLNLEQFPQEFS